jgi:hypothetical protein
VPKWQAGEPTKDNTVKMADDLYAAHDVPEGKDAMYTWDQMVEALREKYDKYHALPESRFCILQIEVYDVGR